MRTAEIKVTVHPDGKFDFVSEYACGYRCDTYHTALIFDDVLKQLGRNISSLDETETDRLDRRISRLQKEMEAMRLFLSCPWRK